MQLRPYQKEQIDLIFKAWAEGYRRVMAQMPTGAGSLLLCCCSASVSESPVVKTLLF